MSKTTHGLIIVHTGDGKGKTTAALGMAMRCVGHGLRVALVQFIKTQSAGECEAAARLGPELEVFRSGRGFVIGEPTAEDCRAAEEALERVGECLRGGRYRMVIADEILTAAGLKLLTTGQVEALLADRPAAVHLVLTGRGAWPSLIERADLVTEMRAVKHPYDKGAAAQEGVEF